MSIKGTGKKKHDFVKCESEADTEKREQNQKVMQNSTSESGLGEGE